MRSGMRRMKKSKTNKLFIFLFTFILLTIYVGVNYYLVGLDESHEVIEEKLYQELKKEYDTLAKEKEIEYEGYSVLGCKVIERNVYTFFDQIMINQGRKDGVKEQDAVITSDGLIGVIKEVYDEYSYVTLITSNEIDVSVKIHDSYGIYHNGTVENIINYSEVEVGDEVYTSGLTNIMGNLYVGKVRSTGLDEYELERKITIDVLDLKNLSYVYVLIGD